MNDAEKMLRCSKVCNESEEYIQQGKGYEAIDLLIKLGEQEGYAYAFARIGDLYFCAMGGVEENNEAALRYYERAAELGDPYGSYCAARSYLNGYGVEINYSKAFKHLQNGINSTITDAKLQLALCYILGRGTLLDEKEGARWMQIAADDGNAEAQGNMGIIYRDGLSVSSNRDMAIRWFRTAIENGNCQARFELAGLLGFEEIDGESYATSNKRDLEEAFNLLNEAINIDEDVRAYQRLAVFYLNGFVVPKDVDKAHELIEIASNQGNAVAQEELKHYKKSLFGKWSYV